MSKAIKNRFFLAAGAVIALASSLFQGQAARPSAYRESVADREKADYIFLEAARYKALDSLDAYYDMIGHALRLNPSDPYLGMEYGMFKTILSIDGKDSVGVEEGLELMKRYLRQNPADNISGATLVRLASRANHDEDALEALRLLYDNGEDPTYLGSSYAKALAYTSDEDSIRKAIGIIDRLESLEGKTVESALSKMQFNLLLGDTAAIFDEASALLKSSPSSIETLTFLGNVNMQFNRPDSALYYFNKAVETDPTNGYAYYSRAEYYNALGDSAAYDREVFQAMRLPDLDFDPKLAILREYVSKLYTDSTQRTRIDALFASMVDQYPHEKELRKIYGSYLWIVNDFEGAAEQYRRQLDLDPDDMSAWGALGQMYYNMNDYDDARKTVDDAIRYFPEEKTFYLFASSIAGMQKEYDAALKYLGRVREITDSADHVALSDIFGAIGDIYYQQKNIDSVRHYYEMALELNPDNSVLLNNMAYYLACEDLDLDKALDYVNRSLLIETKRDGENGLNTLDTYAWVLFKKKDYAKAMEVIDQVLEMSEDQDNADMLEHAGDIYFMNGDPDQALIFWKQALELDPENELLGRKVKHKTFFFK